MGKKFKDNVFRGKLKGGKENERKKIGKNDFQTFGHFLRKNCLHNMMGYPFRFVVCGVLIPLS